MDLDNISWNWKNNNEELEKLGYKLERTEKMEVGMGIKFWNWTRIRDGFCLVIKIVIWQQSHISSLRYHSVVKPATRPIYSHPYL